MIYNAHRARGTSGNLDDLALVVRKTCKTLRKYRAHFDCIVVRGMSGVVVGSPVSLRFRVPLVIVRKESDNGHSSYRGIINPKGLGDCPLFLDDFVSSGATRKAVMKRIAPKFLTCQYEYDYDVFTLLSESV